MQHLLLQRNLFIINEKNESNAQLKAQRKLEATKVSSTLKALQEELEQQRAHVATIKQVMNSLKDSFFQGDTETLKSSNIEAILQHCVLSRLFMSPIDAVFCSQFFIYLFGISTPKYNLMHYLDRFIKLVVPLIFASTEYEASFIGHALNDILGLVNHWAASPDNYARDQASKLGPYAKFTPMFAMWNLRLKSTIVSCLKSKEYMHIRSSLVLLSKIAESFPTRKKYGTMVLEAVDTLEKEETGRSDLSLMAKSLGTILRKRSTTWIDDEKKGPDAAKESKQSGSAVSSSQATAAQRADRSNTAAPKAEPSRAPAPAAPASASSAGAGATRPPAAGTSSGAGESNRWLYLFIYDC